jgi:hypothetical protein
VLGDAGLERDRGQAVADQPDDGEDEPVHRPAGHRELHGEQRRAAGEADRHQGPPLGHHRERGDEGDEVDRAAWVIERRVRDRGADRDEELLERVRAPEGEREAGQHAQGEP